MTQTTIRQGFALFRNPDFVRLFCSYAVTFTGNAMAPIAMAFGVLELTGSTRDSSVVIAAPIAGQILVLLIGGAFADRTSRQRLMVLAESLGALCRFLMAALFLSGQATVPLLALLAGVNGLATGLFIPSTTGFITQVVEGEELQSANSLLGAARSGAVMIGSALAGWMVAWFGAGVTLGVGLLTYAASAGFISRVKARPQESTQRATLWKDLSLGWKEFISHQWLWTIVLQFSLLVAAMESVFGLLGPAVVKLKMNGAVDWGLIASSSGFGTVMGGIVALRLNVARPMLFATICCFFFASLPLALSVPLPLPALALTAFTGGVAGQIFGVLWYTTLQKRVPANLLSRVSAYDHLGSVGLAPLGVVVAGTLFETLGPTRTLLTASAAVIVPTILVLFVPDVRRLRTRQTFPTRHS